MTCSACVISSHTSTNRDEDSCRWPGSRRRCSRPLRRNCHKADRRLAHATRSGLSSQRFPATTTLRTARFCSARKAISRCAPSGSTTERSPWLNWKPWMSDRRTRSGSVGIRPHPFGSWRSIDTAWTWLAQHPQSMSPDHQYDVTSASRTLRRSLIRRTPGEPVRQHRVDGLYRSNTRFGWVFCTFTDRLNTVMGGRPGAPQDRLRADLSCKSPRHDLCARASFSRVAVSQLHGAG